MRIKLNGAYHFEGERLKAAEMEGKRILEVKFMET
jgi:hypothetical protein